MILDFHFFKAAFESRTQQPSGGRTGNVIANRTGSSSPERVVGATNIETKVEVRATGSKRDPHQSELSNDHAIEADISLAAKIVQLQALGDMLFKNVGRDEEVDGNDLLYRHFHKWLLLGAIGWSGINRCRWLFGSGSHHREPQIVC